MWQFHHEKQNYTVRIMRFKDKTFSAHREECHPRDDNMVTGLTDA